MMKQSNCGISTDNRSIILGYDCFSRGLVFTTLPGSRYHPVQRMGIHNGIRVLAAGGSCGMLKQCADRYQFVANSDLPFVRY